MTWETTRSWHVMRYLVYYLVEDFVPPEWVADTRILDFSAGLGDLSRYLREAGAAAVVPTTPDPQAPTDDLDWRTGISAGRLASSFEPASFDLATARMVFQFPTWEGDSADPDSLAEEFAAILRTGGRLVIAFHQFETIDADTDHGRAALVRYLGLPPREGPHGETGYGLKVPMLVTTLQNRGFDIEVAEHVEPFTFPAGSTAMSDQVLTDLGTRVMAIKRRHLVERAPGTYERPGVIREMLEELSELFDFVTWPIVRVVANRR